MAAARSRSRAATTRSAKAVPAEKRERSVSRARASPAPVRSSPALVRSSPAPFNPAAVIPAKASIRKAVSSMSAAPSILEKVDFRGIMKRMMMAYVPAWLTLFALQKYSLVSTYVAPHLVKCYGEKGMVFAAVGLAHLLFYFLPLFAPFETCSKHNAGCMHRTEMALVKVREQMGSLAAALVGAFVMQVPAGVTFTWVFTWLLASDLYILSMAWNHEDVSRYFNTVSCFAICFLHYAFIKLKLVK